MGSIYLIGHSQAAQLTFALKLVANSRNMNFYFINSEDSNDFPYSFWNVPVSSDRLLDYLPESSLKGDYFLTSFQRGHFNRHRDSNPMESNSITLSRGAVTFKQNLVSYLEQFKQAGDSVYLVKDGPLLNNRNHSVVRCTYEFQESQSPPCLQHISRDKSTSRALNEVFNRLARHYDFVRVLGYFPVLHKGEYFSPILPERKHLMMDRHHLSEFASQQLVDFFDRNLVIAK